MFHKKDLYIVTVDENGHFYCHERDDYYFFFKKFYRYKLIGGPYHSYVSAWRFINRYDAR